MNVRVKARTASLVLLIGLALAAGACGGAGSTSRDAYGENNVVSEAGSRVTVDLTNLQFVPQGIRIKSGTTVTWVNKDAVVHNVSQINSVFLSQDELKQGDTFSFTFDKPGTYRYQCTFHHPNMNGVVIVEG